MKLEKLWPVIVKSENQEPLLIFTISLIGEFAFLIFLFIHFKY